MKRSPRWSGVWMAALAALGVAAPAAAQTYTPAYGRISFHMNTATVENADGSRLSDAELWTGVNFRTPDSDDRGMEFGLDLRHSAYLGSDRRQRFSMYDGFAGFRFGGSRKVHVRGGHMWIPELGTVGALAGGLVDARVAGSDKGFKIRLGAFSGLEPQLYETGYAADVRKYGGYVGIERGFLERHLLGYTLIRQGSVRERSVLTSTNYVPFGRSVFVYQAAEVDLQGPADGTAAAGLSYFMTNARITPSRRVDLQVNYNRGRALDARTLTDDVRNGRLIPTQAIDGWRYESGGGRVTVEVVRDVRMYVGYARDRNNSGDAATDRVLVGGHAGNFLGTGFDVSGSASRMERAMGPYHSTWMSLGHGIGRGWYVSGDYSTSLAVIRLLDASGILIENRPATHRLSGTASATVIRDVSLLCTVDYTRDTGFTDVRVLSGASFKLR